MAHSERMPGWRVGRLAAATGVTVRTLHHYEEVGVLVPSGRTEAGHRLYADADVRRLYRVMALRELGMSLAQIRAVLDRGAGLADVLRAHLAHVEESLGRRRALRDRLAGLCERLDDGISTDDLVATIEGMAMQERYFTKEQREALARRREELGDEAIERSQEEWRELAGARARARLHRRGSGDVRVAPAHVRERGPAGGLARHDGRRADRVPARGPGCAAAHRLTA